MKNYTANKTARIHGIKEKLHEFEYYDLIDELTKVGLATPVREAKGTLRLSAEAQSILKDWYELNPTAI